MTGNFVTGLALGAVALVTISGAMGKPSTRAPEKKSDNPTLVGIWQAAPAMGAGWAQTYRFYGDGRVRFHASQIDCQSRLRGWSGHWRVEKDRLILSVERETHHVGGTLQKATGSCGTPLELKGGREKTRTVRPVRKQSLGFVGVRADETNGRPMTQIGHERFWRYANDAGNYP